MKNKGLKIFAAISGLVIVLTGISVSYYTKLSVAGLIIAIVGIYAMILPWIKKKPTNSEKSTKN